MKFREIRTSGEAESEILLAIHNGEYIHGPYIEKVENEMKRITRCQNVIAVSSGTMGLKIALDVLGIKPGDMVIIPDMTFVACALVIMELGAIPVFVDIDSFTFVLDEKSTCDAIIKYGNKIKAIMAVRLGGEPIPEWTFNLGMPVVVDSAHSMSAVDPRAFATVYSFHPSKIISGIEGGLIAISTAPCAVKCRELRCFGFLEGSRVAKEAGYKAYMSNVSAILVYFNLLQLEATLRERRRIRDVFNERFGLNNQGLGMYMVLVSDPDGLCKKIPAIRHYPMTLSKMIDCEVNNPKAIYVTEHLVSLPFHEWLTNEDVDLIVKSLMI